MPSLSLRYAFALGSLPSMEQERTYNGFITVLERTYMEEREKYLNNVSPTNFSIRISLNIMQLKEL